MVSQHLFWITARAAGTAALASASISVAVGLLMSRRPGAERMPLKAAHETLSLVTLALIGVHGATLLGDTYLDPGPAGLTIPFVMPYRPLWTALGIIAAYGLAVLGLTYYARSRIGASRWKRLHRFTALFWVLGIGHAIGAGTDAGEPWFLVGMGCAIVPAAILLAGRLARGGASLGSPAREST